MFCFVFCLFVLFCFVLFCFVLLSHQHLTSPLLLVGLQVMCLVKERSLDKGTLCYGRQPMFLHLCIKTHTKVQRLFQNASRPHSTKLRKWPTLCLKLTTVHKHYCNLCKVAQIWLKFDSQFTALCGNVGAKVQAKFGNCRKFSSSLM